jgi:hypothetical protein
MCSLVAQGPMGDAILICRAVRFAMNCTVFAKRLSHRIIRYVKCALRDGFVKPRYDAATNAYANFALAIR